MSEIFLLIYLFYSYGFCVMVGYWLGKNNAQINYNARPDSPYSARK